MVELRDLLVRCELPHKGPAAVVPAARPKQKHLWVGFNAQEKMEAVKKTEDTKKENVVKLSLWL